MGMGMEKWMSGRGFLLGGCCYSITALAQLLGFFMSRGAGRVAVLCIGRDRICDVPFCAGKVEHLLLRYCVVVVIKHYRCASGISI